MSTTENLTLPTSALARFLDLDRRLSLVVTSGTMMVGFGKPELQYVAFITANVDKYAAFFNRLEFDNEPFQMPVFTQATRAAGIEWYPCGTGSSVEVALAKLNAMIEAGTDSIQESRFLEMVRAVGTGLTFDLNADWKPLAYPVLSQTDEWMVS